MKILFYSSQPYEISAFNAIQNHSHQLSFQTHTLDEHSAKLAEGYQAICAFVNDHLNANTLKILRKIEVQYILLRCAGFNNVDLKAAEQLGITVARVPAYSPHAVAEHATALLLTLVRHTHKAFNRIREGNFSLNGLTGFDLYGKTVGVIGAGKIGECFIKIMLGFGCKVIVYDPKLSASVKKLAIQPVSLDQLFKQSDIISLHCPLTTETKHLINENNLAKTKSGVVIINTSRGAMIDTKAVIKALKQKRISALGIDVYEEEEHLYFQDHSEDIIQDDIFERLITFPNVIATGHQGFLTHEALHNIAQTTLDNASCLEKNIACDNLVRS